MTFYNIKTSITAQCREYSIELRNYANNTFEFYIRNDIEDIMVVYIYTTKANPHVRIIKHYPTAKKYARIEDLPDEVREIACEFLWQYKGIKLTD